MHSNDDAFIPTAAGAAAALAYIGTNRRPYYISSDTLTAVTNLIKKKNLLRDCGVRTRPFYLITQ